MANIWCALRHLMTTPKKWAVKHSSRLDFSSSHRGLAEPPLGCDLVLPQHLDEVHHEVELVLKLGHDSVCSQIAVGLDLTEQKIAKSEGMPWTQSKVC